MATLPKDEGELVKVYAELTGKSEEEVLAKIARKHGYIKAGSATPVSSGAGEDRLERLLTLASKINPGKEGEASPMMKTMMETIAALPMMKLMASIGSGDEGSGKQEDIRQLLKENEDKWERRMTEQEAKRERELLEMKAEQRETALRQEIDSLKLLISSAGEGKKSGIEERLEALTQKLEDEKEKRLTKMFEDSQKSMEAMKEDLAGQLYEMQNREPPANAEDTFFDFMRKMNQFDGMVRERGKSLGMTDEQIEREVSKTKPFREQLLGELGKLGRMYLEKEKEKAEQPPEAEAPQIQGAPQEIREEAPPQVAETETPQVDEQPAPEE